MKNQTYEEFVEKFKPKKTTDDCYTPTEIYEVVKDWACREYDIDPGNIVRPFWPGGDYENFEYPDGCVVLDNPPFSILAKICEYYLERGIPFFLFAPSLTALSGKSVVMRMNHLICDADITYENGAVVRTAFVTSFGGDVLLQTAPDLGEAVNDAMKKIMQETRKEIPKYRYPDHVLTAAMMQKYAKYGIDFKVRRGECEFIRTLDVQKENGKTIYGGGLLLSDKLAREKAAAEASDAVEWELSDREREIAQGLG